MAAPGTPLPIIALDHVTKNFRVGGVTVFSGWNEVLGAATNTEEEAE